MFVPLSRQLIIPFSLWEEDKVAVTPYIEFLMKEEGDNPDKCLKLIKAIEQVHYKERPII